LDIIPSLFSKREDTAGISLESNLTKVRNFLTSNLAEKMPIIQPRNTVKL